MQRLAWQEEAGVPEGISHQQMKQVFEVPMTQEDSFIAFKWGYG